MAQYAHGACVPSPTFGDDVITCTGNVGVIDGFSGNDTIILDAGANILNVTGDSSEGSNLTGFNDEIILNPGSQADQIIGDDFFDTNAENNRGVRDVITINNAQVTKEIVGGSLDGRNGFGGDDAITVENGSVVATIIGDRFFEKGSNLGGNDQITIDASEITGEIIGDRFQGDNNIGGNDTIIIQNGAKVSGIKGDDFANGINNQGADDIISVFDSSVGFILGEDGNAYGGNDTVNLRSATITQSIQLKEGSDIVNIYDLNSKVGGTIDGGDDISSADGYIDQMNLINLQGSMQEFDAFAPTIVNFEYFNIKESSSLDFGNNYTTQNYQQFFIDESSKVQMTGAGQGIYTINADLVNDGFIDFSDGTNGAGDQLIIAGNGDLSGQGAYNFDANFVTGAADHITVGGDVKAQATIGISPSSRTGLYANSIILINAPNDSNKSNEDFNLNLNNRYDGNSKLGRFKGTPFIWQLHISDNNWVISPQSLVNPIDPTNPIAPIEPTEPIEPINPIQPIGPTDPIDPTNPINPPSIVAEIPAYVSLPSIGKEIGFSSMGRLHTRLGEIRSNQTWSPGIKAFNDHTENIWMKAAVYHLNFGSGSSFDLSGIYGGLTVGVDKKLYLNSQWEAYIGLFGGYLAGDFETSGDGKIFRSLGKSNIDLTALTAGGYATFYSDSGSYMDFVVQYMNLRSDVDAAGLQTSIDGESIAASVEIGHGFEFADNWLLEPQIKLQAAHIRWSDFFDGINDVSFNHHTYLTGSAGLRLQKTIKFSQAEIKPWVYLGVAYEFAESPVVNYAQIIDFSTHQYDTIGEIKLGGTAKFSDNMQLYGNIGYALSSDDYAAMEGSFGLRFQW